MTTVATAPAGRALPAERTSQLVWWRAALFFLRGASGLIYQVLWVRLLSRFVLLPCSGRRRRCCCSRSRRWGWRGCGRSRGTGGRWRRAPRWRWGAAAFIMLWVAKRALYAALFSTRFPVSQVEWFREGIETTVSIVRDKETVRTLYTNSRGRRTTSLSLVALSSPHRARAAPREAARQRGADRGAWGPETRPARSSSTGARASRSSSCRTRSSRARSASRASTTAHGTTQASRSGWVTGATSC